MEERKKREKEIERKKKWKEERKERKRERKNGRKKEKRERKKERKKERKREKKISLKMETMGHFVSCNSSEKVKKGQICFIFLNFCFFTFFVSKIFLIFICDQYLKNNITL